MEANSEDENPNNKSSNNKGTGNSTEGSSKPKRQMKTPFQLEILEKVYAQEMYPTEATRGELSEKLGLTDRQLQMWFCHRRLKDKKETTAKKPQKDAPPSRNSPAELFPVVGADPGSDYGSGSGSGSSPFAEPRKVGLDDVPTRRYYESSSPQSILELRAIACVEAQLGEPLREDGPILGVEFDPLPPGAFGAPIAPLVQQQKRLTYPYEAKLFERQDAKPVQASARALNEYQFLQDQLNVRSDPHGHVSQSPYRDVPADTLRQKVSPFVHGDEPLLRVNGAQGQISRVRHFLHHDKKEPFFSPHKDETSILQRDPLKDSMISAQSINHQILGLENPDVFSEARIFHDDMDVHVERKQKSDEARVAREIEAHENRIRKELEKQDILRRKNEERIKKEMERLDRERRKEEERLLRERQREEERAQREQRRELERREKILQKEYLRAEKRRQKEELRKEKEAEKRKVAIEKAAARKIAKEALDLIEDDQLELMELSAASKGLFSIAHLDYESLQNLHFFKESLSLFPPETVELKKPFAIQPWVDSEENIGNVLMVWRFLITFADVLGLWPFTIEEFVQALYDYESRLLGEIHVALLRLIIKDIEDVARTPSGGLGTNQYSAVNPEGGHPKIVEGAYVWGFDIRNWQHHLSPLTWTEIFRQMALAAGFGPQLKKRSAAWTYLGDNDGKGCEDVISTLRNGSAAENALMFMKEKGLLVPRRSRHRLTPGTVKFAAFHVLSLEGNKGLTVLELADKIQKSGLRDLTTSKTPEASISVALTRDQKLFERIAPSTYCVRAAFRKDPADAEAILSAARKKIRMFESGFSTEDADDAERDEDSEGDVEEDPEVDDLAAPLVATKSIEQLNEMNIDSGSGNDNVYSNFSLIGHTEPGKEISASPLNENSAVTNKLDGISEDVGVSYVNVNDMEIDERKQVESWIQGLAEGEYCQLSVEERLNALVALVGVANEGNSIRVVLEERLEAANALKKQMWTEAQSDRSRLKEDIMSRLDLTAFSKAELQVSGSPVKGMQSMPPLVDSYTKDVLISAAEKQKSSFLAQDPQNQLEGVSAIVQDASRNPDNFFAQQHGFTSKRSRSQLKAYIGHAAEETYAYRSLPLGQDRRRNRYWQFVASASKNDPCSGRIFVELHNSKWRVIESVEAFDALVSLLDSRGIRESHLRIMLRKIETSFKENVKKNFHSEGAGCHNGKEFKETYISSSQSAVTDSRSSMLCGPSSDALVTSSWFRIQPGKNVKERYRDFQKWMWKECFSSSTLAAFRYGKRRSLQLLTTCDSCIDSFFFEDFHCHFCHHTFSETDEKCSHLDHAIQCEAARKSAPANSYTIDSLPPGIKLLKALLAFIEVSVPSEVLESFWTESFRRTWGIKLKISSSNEEILQLLTLFESAIRRDRLTSNFGRTRELLGAPIVTGHEVYDSAFPESVPVFPWIPKTSAAVALRLCELDASVIYIPHEKAEPSDDKPLKVFMKLPSRFSSHENKDAEFRIEQQDERIEEEKLSVLRSRRNSHKRGRCSRHESYGKKLQKRAPGPKLDGSKRNTREVVNLSPGLRQQGRRTNGHSLGRGRRTVRRRRVEKMVGESTLLGRMSGMFGPKTYSGSERNVKEEEWAVLKFEADMEAAADNSNSREAAESDDNVDVGEYEQGDWEQNLDATPNGWTRNSMSLTDDDDGDDGDASGDENASLDINRIGDVRNEDSDGDIGLSDGSDEVPSHMGNEEGTDSGEDDYSD